MKNLNLKIIKARWETLIGLLEKTIVTEIYICNSLDQLERHLKNNNKNCIRVVSMEILKYESIYEYEKELADQCQPN